MWGQTSPSVSLTSAALAALVHAAVAAILFLLPVSAGTGEGLSETIIPVTLVAPAVEETPLPEPEPQPEPEPLPAPKPEPTPTPEPEPEPETEPETAVSSPQEQQSAPEAETPPEAMEVIEDTDEPDMSAPPPPEPSAQEDGVALSPPAVDPTSEPPRPSDTRDPADRDDASLAPQAQTSPAGDGRKRSGRDSDTAMTAYLVEVRQHLLQHAPKAISGARDCEVEFRLSPEGEVTSRAIRTSSGTPRYDRRCLKSILTAAPYPAAPPDASADDLHFTITIRQPH
ncbi:TonB family protein [Henriciella litoralis]|uniref:TonB family protein n=1 Tax=Henriciella litoralis TaxID=568102 RepID=UPI000A026495|nr:TonB family protein [Henriciella litoralis]